jgi:hypothetical protein
MARQLANECWWAWEFKKLLAETKTTQASFSKEVGYKPAYINDVFARDKGVSWENSIKIYNCFVSRFKSVHPDKDCEAFAKQVSYVLAKRMIDTSKVANIAILDTSKEKDYYGFPNPHEVLEKSK